jgi:hypothetical protein
VNLADPGRLHPTPPRPSVGRGPATPVGETRPTGPADPGSGPEDVRIVPVRPRLTRHVYAIWRAEAARRPAIRAALAALRTAGETLANPH